MTTTNRILVSLFSIGLLMAAIPFTYAQRGTSRLEGTVRDSSGAIVAGASVTVKNEETGVGTEVFTTDAGTYVFPALQAGTYSVTVELPGFKRLTVDKLKLDIAASSVQNFTLEVGQLQETISVTAAGVAPVQTTTSDIGDTVQGQTIQQLPLNGRNPLELIALQAGIAGNQQMSERGSAASQGTNYAGLGANGSRAVNNAVYLDGVDITNSESGTGSGIAVGTELSQSVDAIGEFRVISANPTAEFGKNSGAQIEIVTRSGTNEFHGSLYHFHRNTIFNANDFFNNIQGTSRPKLIRNQFGGTLGGPVRIPGYNGKNKTFFFVNYEGFRQRQGEIVERTVLTQDGRNGIFRFNRNGPNSPSLVDPSTGQVLSQFANQIGTFDAPNLDRTRWDGIGKDTSGVIDRYIKLMPLPNFFGNPGGNRDGLNFASYRFNAPSPNDRDNWVVKVDHVLSPKHNLSVRYSHGFLTRLANVEPYPGLPNRTRDEFQRGVSINVLSHLTSTLTNEFRFGFSRNRRTFNSLIRPNDIIIDCDDSFDCLGTTNPDLTGENSLTARQTAQFTNNISWSKRNHLFKGGITVRANPLNVRADSNQVNMDFNSEPRNQQNASVDLGQLFGGTIPINATDRINAANFFNFHTGRVGGVIANYNATDVSAWGPLGSARVRGFRQREWGLFFQDDWRLSRKLTLNLGVRYELFEVPYEVNSFYTIPINRNLLDPQIDVNLVAAPLEFGAIGPKNGVAMYPGDHNNFAPTVGFSYDPFGDGKTAIRGAYRISYDKIFTATLDDIDAAAPGLLFSSVINGDTLRNTGVFTLSAPGGLNQGLNMVPRLANLKGGSVGGINLNGTFDLAQFLGSTRTAGGNLPNAPLGKITDTRTSNAPRQYTADFRTAYGQTWSLSIQREIARGTVLEARYLGRKGTKEYLGLPANEFRAPASYRKEIGELQYLLTGGALGIKPAALPAGFTQGTALSISSLFGSTPTTASSYSQFTKGAHDAYAFASFPNLYPFFIAGNNSFDTAVFNAITRNDYVSTLATIDNSTAFHSDNYLKSVPLTAVPSGKGLNPLPADRQPSADLRGRFGGMPIIVGIQPNIFRPNPQFLNGPRVTGNSAFSSYHAFQLQVQRRFYQGLQFQGNYTWSKNLDLTSVSQPTGQDVISFYDMVSDYSYSDNDITHDFKANFIWEAPFGKNRRWLNSMSPVMERILGGWQLAGFIEAATDFPMNIAVNARDRTGPASTGGIRPSFVQGFTHDSEVSRIGNVTKTSNGVSYFKASDFDGILARTLIGNIGNTPRNYWRGPGFFNVDMTVSKTFAIDEQRSIEFRSEFFNLFNHVNFANPVFHSDHPYVDLASSDAGRIISTLGNPRLIQFALKLKF